MSRKIGRGGDQATKRQRLSGSGDLAPQGSSEYRAGAILRVDLVQFQFCSKASYLFGPRLNLIVSPNGTGKSTAAIAIFVVFLGDTKVINRPNLADFIKMGSNYASAKVYVQGATADKVHCVEILITDTGNHSRPSIQRQIDGQPSAELDIQHFADQLNINVNNLCVFLLQDRVSAFSAQTSKELLMATEATVGTKKLSELHQTLIETEFRSQKYLADKSMLSERIEKLQHTISDSEKILKQLDVLREQESRVKDLTAMVVITQNMNVESQVRQLDLEITALQKEISNIDTFYKDLSHPKEVKLQNLGGDREIKKRAFSQAKGDLESHLTDLDQQRRHVQQIFKEFRSTQAEIIKSNEKLMRNIHDKRKTKHLIAEYERAHTDDASLESMETELNRLLEKSNHARKLKDAFDLKQRTLNHALLENARNRKQKSAELQELEEYPRKRLRAMERVVGRFAERRYFEDLQKAVEYVREHAAEFLERVYEPAICSLSLKGKDPLLLKILTTTAKIKFLTAFVTTNTNDFEKLTQLMARRFPQISVLKCTDTKPREFFSTKVDYKSFGFEGVVADVLEGPWPVLENFYRDGLHEMPYSTKPVPADIRDWFFSQGGRSFVDCDALFTQRKSAYGLKATTQGSEQLRACNAFLEYMTANCSEVSLTEKSRIVKSELSTLESKKDSLNMELEAEKSNFSTQAGEIQLATQEYDDYRAKFNRVRKAIAEIDSAKASLNKLDDECAAEESKKITLEARVSTLTNKLREESSVLIERSRLRSQQTQLCRSTRELVSVSLLSKTTGYAINTIAAASESHKNQSQHRIAQLEEEKRRIESGRVDMAEKDRALYSELGRTKYRELKSKCDPTKLKELQDELGVLRAEISLQNQGHSYERTKSLLENARGELATSTAQLEKLEADYGNQHVRFAELRRDYTKQVKETFVPKVNEKFARLFYDLTGCQGAVALKEAANFQDWGLEIKVSFRTDDEDMAVLSGERHSGGERAVSTAIFLMSLQELTKSPFCVIDEINQGMDSSNERKFHNLLMNLALRDGCRDQFIVITPKLLLGLDYNEHVHVLSSFSSSTVELPDLLSVPAILSTMSP